MSSNLLPPHLVAEAERQCRLRHLEVFYALQNGPARFGPPCDECRAQVELDYAAKRMKMHGQQLTPEEAAQERKRLETE